MGPRSHGQLITIAGGGFGSMSRALTPLVRDYGQAGVGVVDPQWTAFGPNSTNPSYTQYNMQNRATNFNPAGSNVGPPHPYVKALTAGAHYSDTSPWGVWLSVGFAPPARPYVVYASWWQLCDPAWNFVGTFNMKSCAWGPGPSIPGDCIYIGYNGPIDSNRTATVQITTNENDHHVQTFVARDRNGKTPAGVPSSGYWGSMPSPWYKGTSGNGQWVFMEYELCADSASGTNGHGYWNLWANGVQVLNYAERTDNFDSISPRRFVSIGATNYSGQYGPPNGTQNNWSYVADPLVDLSDSGVTGHRARVVFGSAPTLKASKLRAAPLSYGGWTDKQIDCTVNRGPFPPGSTVYAHVVTESNGILENQGRFTAADAPGASDHQR
jgi:hypothetical protein